MKRLLLILTLLALTASLCGCGSKKDGKKKNNETLEKQNLVALTKDQLEQGSFYARSGEFFLKLPSGTPHFDIESKIKKADPERVVTFLTTFDDGIIPTIYSDDTLAYCVDTSIPKDFLLERFEDEGYTIGLFGLRKTSGGVSVPVADSKYAVSSDFVNQASEQLDVSTDTEFTISNIAGNPLGESDLSACGSILGMEKDRAYAVDLYAGTQYAGLNITADTHVFSSMELYTLTDFTMDRDGYAAISIPPEMLSGYYYCNQLGMFKYINHPRAQGDVGVDVNIPYYYEDPADGNTITYDEWMEKYGNDTEYVPQRFVQNFNANHMGIEITVKFNSRAELNTEEQLPHATVTLPSGEEIEMERKDNDLEKCFKFTSKVAEAGDWTVSVYHMEGIPYTVESSVIDADADTFVITGKSKGDFVFYSAAGKPYDQVSVSWDNIERAADVTIISPSGQHYSLSKTPENILPESTYGKMIIAVTPEEGEWKVEIKGEDLGRVRYSLRDAVIVEEEESSEEG